MGNLVEFATSELKELYGPKFENDPYGEGMVSKAVIELVKVFAKQGHSGMSASLVLSIFERLANFKPISPIRNIPEQWSEVCTDDSYQHKKDSSVFKDSKDGIPYTLGALRLRDTGGCCFFDGVLGIEDEDGNLNFYRTIGQIKDMSQDRPQFVVDVVPSTTESGDVYYKPVTWDWLDGFHKYYEFVPANL